MSFTTEEMTDLIAKQFGVEADRLGVEFRGFFPGEPLIPDFFDPLHGGNFNLREGESVEIARDRKRAEFAGG